MNENRSNDLKLLLKNSNFPPGYFIGYHPAGIVHHVHVDRSLLFVNDMRVEGDNNFDRLYIFLQTLKK